MPNSKLRLASGGEPASSVRNRDHKHRSGCDLQTSRGLSAEVLAELKPTTDNALPKVRQLYLALYRLIERGDIAYHTRLPASRVLAQDIGVGRNTVIQVFEQLVAEGLLTSNGRNGTRVVRRVVPKPATSPVTMSLSRRSQQLKRQGSSFTELAPGEPDSALFPHELWRKAASKAARQSKGILGYQAQALSSTREAIARYLSNYRSLQVDPEQIIVTASTRQSLTLAASLFTDVGDIAWMECPGYVGAVEAFNQLGLQVVPHKVDAYGIQIPNNVEQPPSLIYVTPCFQYPHGVALAAERREALLDLSARYGTVVFEDDYDSEFRNSTQPRPALATDTHGAVVLNAGTFSKLVFPAIRVAWLVVPPGMAEPANRVLKAIGGGNNTVAQLAVTELLNNGAIALHLNRAKQVYAQRREAFMETMNHCPWVKPSFTETGSLSVVLNLTTSVDINALQQSLEQQRLGAIPLERLTWTLKKPQRCNALVVGLGNVNTLSIPDAVQRLNRAFEQAVRWDN